jgi:hypothetical protein
VVSDKVFAEVMGGIQTLYKENMDEFTLRLYKNIFDKNFDDATLQEATIKLIESRVYPTLPKPAEFIEVMKPRKIDIEAEALIEAAKLKKAIMDVGKYESVAFDNYLIHKIIKTTFGSWVKICNINKEELEKFIKWDFPKLYKIYSDYKMLEDIPIYLTGVAESLNKHLETEIRIKYIGNKQKAVKWQTALSNKNKMIPEEKILALGFKDKMKPTKEEVDVKSLIEEAKHKFKVDKVDEKKKAFCEPKSKEEVFEEIKNSRRG